MFAPRLTLAWLLRAALVGWIAVAQVAIARTPEEFRGVYVSGLPLRKDAQLLPDAVYRLPQVDGVYPNLLWNVLAPAPGQYDWTLLDKEVRRAVEAGKWMTIGIRTGRYTPAWVLDEARHSTFVVGPHGGRAGRCQQVSIAWPWDARYQQRYGELMRALAAHLRTIPGGYEAVRIVKITGINQETQELRLPASRATEATESSCALSDALEVWRRSGYDDAKVVDAWVRLAKATDAAFPDKVLGIDVLQRNDFPKLDRAPAAEPKARIVQEGLRLFPGRFAVQWNGLSAKSVTPFVVEAGRAGAIVGWQSNLFRGLSGAGCDAETFANARPCTPGAYAAILRNGIENGASYLEVWVPDAMAFPQEIGAAGSMLRSGRKRQ
jgi:hypothetical protein